MSEAVSNPQVMLLHGQLKQAFDTLTGTMQGVSSEVAHQVPAGIANTIAANAAHAVSGIDGIINAMVLGGAPVMASATTGCDPQPPMAGDWGDWGRTVQVDLETLHGYAKQVMETVTENMQGMSDDALGQMIKSQGGLEMPAAAWIGIAINNTCWHTGEIAALKGIQGLKGYPF